MAALSATWTVKTVKITYRNPLTLVKESGSWTVETTGRVTNTLTDGTKQVFRPGKINQGILSTVEGEPSLSVDVPVIDDPDNSPQGGSIKLSISFNSSGGEVFTIYPLSSWPNITDIGDLLEPTITPGVATYVIKGVAGGVAALNSDGKVIDAAGNVVSGGSGGVVGVLAISQMAPGTSYKLFWDDTNKKWTYVGSGVNAVTARLNSRTDVFIDFIGGRESDRPTWGQLNGDTQEVTIS